jgi:hypothetical protein
LKRVFLVLAICHRGIFMEKDDCVFSNPEY